MLMTTLLLINEFFLAAEIKCCFTETNSTIFYSSRPIGLQIFCTATILMSLFI